jgi:putative oxidoreductase
MAGAIATVHGANGFFMDWNHNQHAEGFEYHLLAIGLALVVLLKGSGALSVDRMLRADERRDTSDADEVVAR